MDAWMAWRTAVWTASMLADAKATWWDAEKELSTVLTMVADAVLAMGSTWAVVWARH